MSLPIPRAPAFLARRFQGFRRALSCGIFQFLCQKPQQTTLRLVPGFRNRSIFRLTLPYRFVIITLSCILRTFTPHMNPHSEERDLFHFNRWSCRRPDDFIPPVPVRKRRKAEYCCIFCENCRYGPFFIASSVENRKIQNALLQILSDWDTIFKKTTETVENSVKKPHPRPIPPSVLHSLSPGFKASPLLK